MRISPVHQFKHLFFVAIAFVPCGFVQPTNGITKSASPPLILYTDIISGPNSGGEGDNGIYLTIFGTHFGATRGTSKVTINGHALYELVNQTKFQNSLLEIAAQSPGIEMYAFTFGG